jgi:hypothetical protein
VDVLIPGAKLQLGQVVITVGAKEAFYALGQNPFSFLVRHAQGDWGDLDAEDHRRMRSLDPGLCVLSAYALSDGTRFWIITEADRSVTTILLPSEY